MRSVYVEMSDETACEDMGIDPEEASMEAVAWHKGTTRREIEFETWEDFVMPDGYEFLEEEDSEEYHEWKEANQ